MLKQNKTTLLKDKMKQQKTFVNQHICKLFFRSKNKLFQNKTKKSKLKQNKTKQSKTKQTKKN